MSSFSTRRSGSPYGLLLACWAYTNFFSPSLATLGDNNFMIMQENNDPANSLRPQLALAYHIEHK